MHIQVPVLDNIKYHNVNKKKKPEEGVFSENKNKYSKRIEVINKSRFVTEGELTAESMI